MRWLPVVLLAACAAQQKPPTHAEEPLPFIEDDYAQALKVARAEKRPLFIETWAPW
jgi:hypothetical protein